MLVDLKELLSIHYDALDADIRITKVFSFSLIMVIEDLDSVFWHKILHLDS